MSELYMHDFGELKDVCVRLSLKQDYPLHITPTLVALSCTALLPDGVECNGAQTYTTTITFDLKVSHS